MFAIVPFTLIPVQSNKADAIFGKGIQGIFAIGNKLLEAKLVTPPYLC